MKKNLFTTLETEESDANNGTKLGHRVLQRGEASLGHRNKISCFRPLGLVPVQFARPPTGALQSDQTRLHRSCSGTAMRLQERLSALFAELANPPRRLIQLTRYFGFRKLCRSRLIVLYKQSWCSLSTGKGVTWN